MRRGVGGKKFHDRRVVAVRGSLWPGARWDFGLVAAEVKHPGELEEIRSRGIEVIELVRVLDDLTDPAGHEGSVKKTSSPAADIAALIGLDRASARRS